MFYKLVILSCAIYLTKGNERQECVMEGIENWYLAVPVNIMDTDRQVEIFRRTTENIEAITLITQGEALNKGPYLTMSLVDSSFVVSTNEAFDTYENDETSLTIGSVVHFRCTSGSTSMLVITVTITDTNNHSPEFVPPNYRFTIAPPVPPGFVVTDCINDVISRDVDLTTYMIDFELAGSDLFEIAYDDSTEPKNFKALLRTATFIRTIPEPIVLTVRATDVDRTGNDPRTVETTITIDASNSEFEFPDEPVFSQAYYLATYTETNQLVLQDTIQLRQGFDNQVTFSFDGDLMQHFHMDPGNNDISFQVLSAIPVEEYPENGQIYLVVSAEREYTSGAMATVIVQFPGAKELKFEELAYSGTLEDNIVNLPSILLNVGADITVLLKLEGDYSEHFSAQQSSEHVFISVDNSLPSSALLENNIMLTLIASVDNVLAYTTLFLDVISDDYVTPTFSKHVYNGRYIDDSNIDIEDIVVSQGLDESVTFDMDEEYSEYFEIVRTDNGLQIQVKTPLSKDLIFQEKVVIFNVLAKKPRTVGANAIVSINFPEDLILPTVLMFSKNTYSGQLEGNSLTTENIILERGYSIDTKFALSGEHESLFRISEDLNNVFITTAPDAAYEDLFDNKFIVLEVTASSERSISATSTLVIDVSQTESSLIFEEPYYTGTLVEPNRLEFTQTISLRSGFDDSVEFHLEGDTNEWFTVVDTGTNSLQISLNADVSIPEQVLQQNTHLIYTLVANKPGASGQTIILIEVLRDSCSESSIRFSQDYYVGTYEEGTIVLDSITVISYSDDVILELIGDFSNYFQVYTEDEIIRIRQIEGAQINLESNFLVLTLEARTSTSRAHTIIVLKIINDQQTNLSNLNFSETFYVVLFTESEGLMYNSEIILRDGYDETVRFSLEGDSSVWFTVDESENPVVLGLTNSLPSVVIQNNNYLSFVIKALNGENVAARATIIVDIITDNPSENRATFDKVLYVGSFQENVVTQETIAVLNHDGSPVLLSGDYAQLFEATIDSNGVVTVVRTSSGTIPADITSILLEMAAGAASAVLGLNVIPSDNPIENTAAFDKILYIGHVQENVVTHETITVLHHDGSPVVLSGSYAQLFETTITNGVVTVSWTSGTVPADITSIPLEMRAGAASAVLVLSVAPSDNPIENTAAFDKILYIGQVQENVVTHETITVLHHDGSSVLLSGSYAQLFEATISNGVVTVSWTSGTVPADITSIPLEMRAGAASAVLVLSVAPSENPSKDRAAFDKVLYIGQIQENVVTHETITVLHHDGSPVELSGEYAQLFGASIANGVVSVTSTSSVILSGDITSVFLEIKVGEAMAVLILNVIQSEQPVLPTVTFSSSTYTLRTDVSQTGVIGAVHATADNGEPISYALLLDNDHLRERLSVNRDGEISLSAPGASGGYNFQVQATAIVNRVSAVAEVSLWVEAVTICDTDIVLHPLIVIERLEEEPHRDLVILNQQEHAGCKFELTNHWPTDQNWLYVDAEGLHARVIDREHESIAFMHVSQVQVELVLHCENDVTRHKRSLDSYDYGSKSWILTDTILYNSRRSLVNLIVIDINDNAPIFEGKENEPIYVGYPTNELEDTILPRSLVELKATDADIGENAEILYWSAEENLAVAPTTGFVHVRQSALLADNSRFTIYATDQNGRGLNGSIDIVVKLLDENHIAVVTISDVFLDDEQSIIKDISAALGYDVKILKAAVVSTDINTYTTTRNKRETDNTGASLQLYVYGIDENNAVDVHQLTSDISNSNLIAVSIARVLSLEDHLLLICPLPARETALLAATISLAVLLLLIITVITVREFLKRRKVQSDYEQFSDAHSLASRNNSIQVIPKVETLERPRLNKDELRKSEKRLQDMLNEERREEPVQKKETEPVNESIIDMPVPLTPEPEQQMPIVIQSIDKLKDSNDDSDGDEFGEVKNNRRKSVVTFNENVEKIIHIENRSESISSDSTDFEVYKF